MKVGCHLFVQKWLKKAMRPQIQEVMRAGSGALRMAIDCGLDSQHERKRKMSDKELSSLAVQLMLCHSANYGHPSPAHLHLVGLMEGGREDNAFREHIQSYHSLFLTKTELPPDQYFSGDELIYLSPDSSEELDTVEAGPVYVMGGVVDRTVDKGVALRYAQRLGIRSAKLPLHRYVKLHHHANLPINIVVEMMLSVYNGHSWATAVDQFIPKRKQREQ